MSVQEHPGALPRRKSSLAKRVVSAAVLIPPVLACVHAGGIYYTCLVLLLTVICAFEWQGVTACEQVRKSRFSANGWRIQGAFYLAAAAAALLALRAYPQGAFHCYFLAVTVWGTDTGAMFAGKTIGGPKVLPAVSPNKTWAGLAGGTLVSVGGAYILMSFIPGAPFAPSAMLALAACITVIAQAGDFYESWMKRVFGVKDSGTLIPGHGGALDRADGLFSAALFYALLLAATGAGGG